MAEWIRIEKPDEHFQCSECGMKWFLAQGTPLDNEMYYCPRCGAKLSEKENSDGANTN